MVWVTPRLLKVFNPGFKLVSKFVAKMQKLKIIFLQITKNLYNFSKIIWIIISGVQGLSYIREAIRLYWIWYSLTVGILGTRVIRISGSLIWSKTLMELIFNPCGEFRWGPEGPVSQIHSPHLHVGAPGILSDLLRSVQMLKREWGAESNGKLPHIFNLWWIWWW